MMNTTSESSKETKKKVNHTGAVPRKEADIITVANDAVAAWEQHQDLTLKWTNPAELKNSIVEFKTSVGDRKDITGLRVTITGTLKTINVEINDSSAYVKGYIADKFSKKAAPEYYAQFGFVKTSRGFRLPDDNDKRLLALEQLVKAIDRHGLGDQKYGKQYWTDLYVRFASVKKEASGSDSLSAEHLNIKAAHKPLIKKTLNALISLIKANYPDDWKEELRVWGFHKEKY